MEKQCAAVRVDGEGQGIRIYLSGAVCQSTGPGSGGGTVGNHDALEQRTVRRTHKPAEGDQAPDVRKGEVRTSQSPCVALGGIGTSLKPAPKASALARNDPTLLTKPDPSSPPSAEMISPSVPLACGRRRGTSGGSLYPSRNGAFLPSAEAFT